MTREADMKRTAHARFAIKSWEETTYSEGQDLPRLSRASVAKTSTGDIDGEGQVEYLMVTATRLGNVRRPRTHRRANRWQNGERVLSARASSRVARRRRPISRPPDPRPENSVACGAMARRPSGTGWSTRSCWIPVGLTDRQSGRSVTAVPFVSGSGDLAPPRSSPSSRACTSGYA